jgi:hypothetical protein
MSEENSKQLFWYRVKFITLVAVFLSPFIGGWLALYVFEIRPESNNYGELVQPVKKLNWPVLQAANGDQFDQGFGRKWTFIVFAGNTCEAQCQSNLFYMRQIRILLGRDSPRLQNVLILRQAIDDELKAFLVEYPSLVVIENYRGESLYSQFKLEGVEKPGSTAKMYLVDPAQNLMMHYAAESEQNRILEDLRKLMKLSQIG